MVHEKSTAFPAPVFTKFKCSTKVRACILYILLSNSENNCGKSG